MFTELRRIITGGALLQALTGFSGCYYTINWWGTHDGDNYGFSPSPYTHDTCTIVIPYGDVMHVYYSFGSCASTWSEITKDGVGFTGTLFTEPGLYELHLVTLEYDVRKAWYLEVTGMEEVGVQEEMPATPAYLAYDPASQCVIGNGIGLPAGPCQCTLTALDGREVERRIVLLTPGSQTVRIPIGAEASGVLICELRCGDAAFRRKILVQ